MDHHQNPSRSSSRMIARGVCAAILLSLVLTTGAADDGPAGVVEDFLSAYRVADVEKMTAIYAPGVRFVDVNQRHELTGREAMRESLSRLAAIHKEIDVEIKRQAVTGDLVTVEVVYSGTLDGAVLGRPDDEDLEYALPAVLLFEVADGHIESQTDYLDYRTFTESFAALQPPASTQ